MTTETAERIAPELQKEWEAFFKCFGRFPPVDKMTFEQKALFDARMSGWLEGRAALRKEMNK